MPALEDHPLSEIFPLMGDADLAALADDIEANGLRDPVWLYEGKILDGRNRYRACKLKDIDHRVEHYKGRDPLGFVISKNLHRRHLTESQRAMVAANIATAKRGGDRVSDQPANLPVGPEVTQKQAAELLQVGERSVRDAVKVQADGVPELVEAVVRGDVSVSAAAEVAKLPEAEQQKAVTTGTVKDKAKQQRAKKKKPAAPTEDKAAADDKPVDDPAAAFVAVVESLCRDIDQIANRVKALKQNRFHYSMHVDSALDQIRAARKTLWVGRPDHVCPHCTGTGCKTCNNTGRVKKDTHTRGVEAVGGAK